MRDDRASGRRDTNMSKGTSIIGFLLSFIAGIILMWGIDRGTHGAAGTPTADKQGGTVTADGGLKTANAGAVKVTLYVMAKCPYGVQAENGFKDVVDKFGADIDFKVEYIGNKGPDGAFTSLHGPTEVVGDTYQVCAQKYSAKWFDTILCQNAQNNAAQVDTTWEGCGQQAGIPPETIAKVTACAQGDEGKGLLAASFQKATDHNVRGSPTIYIGDTEYQGGRKTADFMKGICAAYAGAKPAICNDIPEPPKVNVTLLGDKRCGADCDTKRLDGVIHQRVGNPIITTLDYTDAAGKALYDSIKPVKLPAVVFDSSLDADKDASAAFGQSARAAGQYKVIAAGDWSPACADPDGCKLDECKANLTCRDEKANKLEVFVMSHCPFGVKGMDAMQEVVDNFKKNKVNIDFAIHYIGDGDSKTQFNSMHGPSEVADDLREVCAIDHYGKDLKFMDYIWCRDKKIPSEGQDPSKKFADVKSALADDGWQGCTGDKTGFDTDTIKKCADGDEGKSLLEASFKYSKDTGMQASPTWLVNNKFKFSGIDPETVKENFCQHNKVDGCDAKLSGPPAPPAGAPGGKAAPAPGCGG